MKYRILIASVLMMGVLSGCGNMVSQMLKENVLTKVQEEQSSEQEEEEDVQILVETEQSETFSFSQLENQEFYFSSGAGAWYTVLRIHADGTFSGHYQDANMGDSGPKYPGGKIYYSDFKGSFSAPERVNDTAYMLRISSIEYPLGMGEEIKNGVLYDYTTAYGLEDGEDFYLYLPGAKLSELPESFLQWTGNYCGDTASAGELSCYGFYNEHTGDGFSSQEVSDARQRIRETLTAAEAMAGELEETLQKDGNSQADLNQISGELYRVWDDALNVIWGILKENLPEESMKALTVEERAWIAEKEAAVQAAGAEYEGGSMRPLICNSEAARLTKERAYELGEILK